MAPAGSRHGRTEGEIFGILHAFVRKNKLGVVFPGDSGFLLERNEDTVRCPDVAFVWAARMPAEPIDGFFPGPPDLAVEIRSPSTRLPELLAKISHYLETGVKVVWDVDLETQTVTIFRAAGTVETFSGDATLTEPELLPGFSVALKEIFVW
jgi:Uma2 family endonuclease